MTLEEKEIILEMRKASEMIKENSKQMETETDKFLDTALTYASYAAVGVIGAVVTALYYRSLE